jgi:protein disulfide-isomerase
MKQILFTSAWLFISPILCAPPVVNRAEPVSIQTAAAEAPVANGIPDDIKSTVFNGVEVPPMKELSGDQFDTEIKDGYW